MIIALSTCAPADARKIAEILVEEKLVASVNLVRGVETRLRWEGAPKWQEEVLLIMRTKGSLASRLVKRVAELSSFEVPETACFEIHDPNENYQRWLLSSVAEDNLDDTFDLPQKSHPPQPGGPARQ